MSAALWNSCRKLAVVITGMSNRAHAWLVILWLPRPVVWQNNLNWIDYQVFKSSSLRGGFLKNKSHTDGSFRLHGAVNERCSDPQSPSKWKL